MAQPTNSSLQLGPLCDRIRARSRSEDCASGFVRDAATPPLLLLRAATLYDGLPAQNLRRSSKVGRERCRPCVSHQLVHKRSCHVTLGDHVQRVAPTRPVRWYGGPTCAPQSHPSKRVIVSLVALPTLLTNTSTVPRRRNWDNSSGTTLMKCSARATKQQRKVRNAVQQDLLVCPNQPELVRDVILDGQVVCPDLDTSLH